MTKLAVIRGAYVLSIVLIVISLFVPAWSLTTYEKPGEVTTTDAYFYGATVRTSGDSSSTFISIAELDDSSQLALIVLFLLSLASMVVLARHILSLTESEGIVTLRSGKGGLALLVLVILIPVSFMLLWGNSMLMAGLGFWGGDALDKYGPGAGWFLSIAAVVPTMAGFTLTSKGTKQPRSSGMLEPSSFVIEAGEPIFEKNENAPRNKPDGSKFCMNCGRPIPEVSVFCQYCGLEAMNKESKS